MTPNPALDPSLTRPSPLGDFEEFWTQYPKRDGKRVGKKDALKQWKRLNASQRAAALRAVGNYADSGRLPKDAHRWLRDECWVDWQTPAVKDQPKPAEQAVY